jgi:hypothetical protein
VWYLFNIPNSEALIQGMNYLRKLIAEKAGLDPISTPCTIQKVAHPQGKIIIVVAIDLPAAVIPLIKPMIGSSLEKLGNYTVDIQFLMPPINSSKWKRLMIHTQESRQQHFENYPGGEPEARRRIHMAPWAEQDPYALKILREATQHLEWLSLDNRFKNTPVTSFKIYAGAHLLKVTDVGPNDIESYLTTKTNTFFELNETRRGTTSGTRLEKCTLKTECQHEASKFLSMSTTELIIYIPGKCYLPVKMGTRRTERRNTYEEQSSGKASGITCNAFAGLCIQGTFSNPQAQIMFHALEKRERRRDTNLGRIDPGRCG